MPTFTTSIQHCTRILRKIWQEKGTKGIRIVKEEVKLPLLA